MKPVAAIGEIMMKKASVLAPLKTRKMFRGEIFWAL
jgi:hypothetical protein